MIREMTYAELAAADAGRMFTLDGATFPFREKGIRVPRLSEVLAEFPKLRMIVEVKQIAPSVVAPMLDLHRSRRDAPQCARRQRASAAARRSPHAGAGNPDQLFVSRIGSFLPGDGAARDELSSARAALQIPHRHESWELVTPESVELRPSHRTRSARLDRERGSRDAELLDMGVDGLISDYPRRLLDVVRSRASAPPLSGSFQFGARFVTISPARRIIYAGAKNYEARHRSLDAQLARCSGCGARRRGGGIRCYLDSRGRQRRLPSRRADRRAYQANQNGHLGRDCVSAQPHDYRRDRVGSRGTFRRPLHPRARHAGQGPYRAPLQHEVGSAGAATARVHACRSARFSNAGRRAARNFRSRASTTTSR